MFECNVCRSGVSEILELQQGRAVTSLGRVVEATAKVLVCHACSHCQTATSIDLDAYYASDYKTLSASPDEDDLYSMVEGKPLYRNEHMANLLKKKLPDVRGDVLDYGCGKSLVMKHLSGKSGKPNIHLYDVSEEYTRFWDSFIPRERYSCFKIPGSWRGKFELVTSFFSMEHVPRPWEVIQRIRDLLMPGGYLYLVVPNMYSSNIADMLVVDHVQHFSELSLRYLLRSNGFEIVELDTGSHEQATICVARTLPGAAVSVDLDTELVQRTVNECGSIAATWAGVRKSIVECEEGFLRRGAVEYYICGAGVIGSFVYATLNHPEKVAAFVDNNAFKQEKGWQGKPVYSPRLLEDRVGGHFFSGFNREQNARVLPNMLPKGVPVENVWKMNS